ncbi:hypothetical protein C2E23DRAFT_888445 [Lenzites betulinus]|nr:hypothetical protein C2E23DRAFT_888445 [Lenzites betulinus]
MLTSFLDRVGRHEFRQPSIVWGYLPQLNEWGKTALEWEVDRVDGADHVPIFKATPVYEGERLLVFAAMGGSKKAAKERAAELMALSGHCLDLDVTAMLS